MPSYHLDEITQCWIQAERTQDPADINVLFEALTPFVTTCLHTYFTPSYLEYLQHHGLHWDTFEDYLQEFWIQILRKWENVVPFTPLIYQTVNFWAREYKRTTTNSVLRRSRKAQRDWSTSPQ